MRRRLHDDWSRLGQRGRDYFLTVGEKTVKVTTVPGGEEPGKPKTYTLDPVYGELLRAAYEAGLAHKALW